MGNVAVRGNVAVSYFDFRSHLCPSRVPGDECTECASSSSVSSSRWLLLVLPLIGFGLLLFFVGVIGSFVGAYFREYFQPPRTRMVGWKFLSLGLLTAGVAAMLPLYPYSSDVSPVGLWGSTLPIIPFIGGLVFAGLVSMVFGFRRTRDLDSERVGLMVVAGLIVFGLSLISIGLTYGASLTPPCHRSCQDFQLISALLASSLLISSGAIVACLVSDQKEGVAELIDNRGSSARTRQP